MEANKPPEKPRRARPGAPGVADVGPDRYRRQFGVTVVCDSEDQQRALFERLRADGLRAKVVCT